MVSTRSRVRRAARRLVLPLDLVGWWTALSTGYLLLALLAAWRFERQRDGTDWQPDVLPHLLVLVPAHDEEPVIGATVRALLDADYALGRRRVVVVADNCRDATASVARGLGAEVWERNEPDRPGKGQAIHWALQRLPPREYDAVVMVDADCIASENLLVALAGGVRAGADAVQAAYFASNPTVAPAAALRFAGFVLMNWVRPLAKARLGLSVGLLGTGMALPVETLETVPWGAFTVTEDREYHLRLVEAGLAARFAPQASVASEMPATHAGGAAQQTRWDTGNVLLARRFVPRLIRVGLRRRSRDAIHAALELLIPPQTMLSAAGVTTLVAGLAMSRPRLRALGQFTVIGQVVYVLGGLRLAHAPPAVFRALAHSPALLARRVAQHALIISGRASRAWVRTERSH
jgi:cellulose synthase/poly-beta-1,6-N-acetylglucosamine synthase-like glycosyltransferase